jgi:hypothetical protein
VGAPSAGVAAKAAGKGAADVAVRAARATVVVSPRIDFEKRMRFP